MTSDALSFPPNLSRSVAITRLGAALDMPANPDDRVQRRAVIAAAIDAELGVHNGSLRWRASGDLGAAGAAQRQPAGVQEHPAPTFLNSRPACLPSVEAPAIWRTSTPAMMLLNVPFGYVAKVANSPLILGGDRMAITDYSSDFAGLARFYDRDVMADVGRARFIEGRALVLHDDAFKSNYCHWLVDWLPRLTLLRNPGEDVSVIVSPLTAAWQAEMLGAAGFRGRQVVELHPWDVVQARQLHVPSHLSEMFHPASSGSPWAVDFVRGLFLGEEAQPPAPTSRRLYISRGDAGRRRVVNEAELFARLRGHGFENIILTGLSVVEQASLFASAGMIVGPHGAGLTNICFAAPGTRVVEIFPRTYGTPTFWILAGAAGLPYATYIVDQVESASRSQMDDLVVDIDDFERRAIPFLLQANPQSRDTA